MKLRDPNGPAVRDPPSRCRHIPVSGTLPWNGEAVSGIFLAGESRRARTRSSCFRHRLCCIACANVAASQPSSRRFSWSMLVWPAERWDVRWAMKQRMSPRRSSRPSPGTPGRRAMECRGNPITIRRRRCIPPTTIQMAGRTAEPPARRAVVPALAIALPFRFEAASLNRSGFCPPSMALSRRASRRCAR